MSTTQNRVGSNSTLRYFYESWVQACGPGWTPVQVAVGYTGSIVLATAVVLLAHLGGAGWTWWQTAVVAVMSWDLFGGVIGYNNPAMVRRQVQDSVGQGVWHHNFQHVHPLVLIFFANKFALICVAAYWFVTFLLFVELLEPRPKTGAPRLGMRGQRWALRFEILAALGLVTVSWFTPDVSNELRIFGGVVFGLQLLSTLVITRIPFGFRPTVGAICAVTVIVLSQQFTIPLGLVWFVPVYVIKLLIGFTPASANTTQRSTT